MKTLHVEYYCDIKELLFLSRIKLQDCNKYACCVFVYSVFKNFISFQQEIMVGSQYQAEIPSLICYNEHEKGKLLTFNENNIHIFELP